MTDYATDLQGRFSKFLNKSIDRATAAAKELEAKKYSAEKWTGDSFSFWKEAINLWLYPWELVRGLEPTLQMFIEQGKTEAAGKTSIADIGSATPKVGALTDVNGTKINATATATVTGTELVVKLKNLKTTSGTPPPAGTYEGPVTRSDDSSVIAKIVLEVLN